MSDSTLQWRCQGPPQHWCDQLRPLFSRLENDLDLNKDFCALNMMADLAAEEESCWFTRNPGQDQSSGRADLDLHFSIRSLSRPGPGSNSVFAPDQVWEKHPDAYLLQEDPDLEFSLPQAESFLYHNLLLARDLVRGEIPLGAIPAGQLQAFESAWEVVVDGRLARQGLPGIALEIRRASFSQLFSSAGVLLPDHWQIFQSLWDGGLTSGKDILAVLRQLPRL